MYSNSDIKRWKSLSFSDRKYEIFFHVLFHQNRKRNNRKLEPIDDKEAWLEQIFDTITWMGSFYGRHCTKTLEKELREQNFNAIDWSRYVALALHDLDIGIFKVERNGDIKYE